MDGEVELFKRFSALSHELGKEREIGKAKRSEELDWLFKIHKETKLLMEIKDIRDELNMLDYLLNDQKKILEEFDFLIKNMKGIEEPEMTDRQLEKSVEAQAVRPGVPPTISASKMTKAFRNQPHSTLLEMVNRRIHDIAKLERQAKAAYLSVCILCPCLTGASYSSLTAQRSFGS